MTNSVVQKPSWNPLCCRGTDLPTNLTVMAKVLAIALLFTNHVRMLPDPWLPFIPWIERIPPSPFQWTLRTVFVFTAVCIIFNRRVRLSSLVLGTTLLVAIVSSKAYYGNNKTFCGLMLLLAALHKPGAPPFIQWQLAVTYFGAGLNKLLDVDWQSGVFFENWAVHRLHQSWYIALDSILPSMFLARMICWTTIITELGIVPCILVPSFAYGAIVCNVLFQSSLLLFTGTTFTLFFYGMTAASFAFVEWPAEPVQVCYDPARKSVRPVRRLLEFLDFDRRFVWISSDLKSSSWLRMRTETFTRSGFDALRTIVLLNPATYFIITAAIAVLEELPTDAALHRRLIVGTSLVLLLPPLSWAADRLSQKRSVKGSQTSLGVSRSANA